MYLGLGGKGDGKKSVVVSHPSLKLDVLGDTISSNRHLYHDGLDTDAVYCLKKGMLLQKLEKKKRTGGVGLVDRTDVMKLGKKKVTKLSEEVKKNRMMSMVEKLEIYTREFWERLQLDSGGTADDDENSSGSTKALLNLPRRWGTKGCPGTKRIQKWLKAITKEPLDKYKSNSSSEEEGLGVEYEDACRDDHSDSSFSFKDDREEDRTFNKESFLDGVRYALYMTFGNTKPGKARPVFTDPAIVFRMYLSRYLHSDFEREKARKLLNKAPHEKRSFCKIVKAFLKALREGSADATPTKKNFIAQYRDIKNPEEVVKMELDQEANTELRTGNLQECIESWIGTPVYINVLAGQSLIDSPDESNSVDMDQEISQKPSHGLKQEFMRSKRYLEKLNSIKKFPKKYLLKIQDQNYLKKLDVSFKDDSIALLCANNDLHYVGQLNYNDINILIDSSEKYVSGDSNLKNEHRRVIYEIIPLIRGLIDKKDEVKLKERIPSDYNKINTDMLLRLMDKDNQKVEGENITPTKDLFEESGSLGVQDDRTEEENTLTFTEENAFFETESQESTLATMKFYVNRLRKYNFLRKKLKSCTNPVKYNKKFDVLINEKENRIYSLPRFYKFGKWTKHSRESLEKFLKSQNVINNKCDYMINHGMYFLKGQEKVIKKCLLALKMLGINNVDLKLSLLLYTELHIKEASECPLEELFNVNEKFKNLIDTRNFSRQLNQLYENIRKADNTKRESWLLNDKDYQMKTFISGKKKHQKRYENFFNLKININDAERQKSNSLENYRYYNYKTDHNFEQVNDYSSEEGDVNENHYLDNLCSCGVVKEVSNVKVYPSKSKGSHYQIEYHHRESLGNNRLIPKSSGYVPPEEIKITGFNKLPNKPRKPTRINSNSIEMISRDSMMNLHSVFDNSLEDFNKDHVLRVVDFIKNEANGRKCELVLNPQELPKSDQIISIRCTTNEHSKFIDTGVQESQVVESTEKWSSHPAEKYLHTEYYPEEKISKKAPLYASEQVLPTKYLERVFHHIQNFP